MKHIIISYAAKQAGKTTSATALYGYYLTSLGIIPNCHFDPSGRMSVVYNKKTNEGIIYDIDDNSPEMVDFNSKNVWGYVKHESFATALKDSIVSLFGIKREYIYGTDEDKNRATHIKWSDVWNLLSEDRQRSIERKWLGEIRNFPKFLTIRELCQVFGTDMCRVIDEDCHLRSAVNKLISGTQTIGLILDGRFDNEFFYFDKPEAKELLGDTKVWRVKYTRNSSPDNPPGEQGLPEVDESLYDLVIDNRKMDVLKKNEIFIDFFIKAGVLSKTGVSKE